MNNADRPYSPTPPELDANEMPVVNTSSKGINTINNWSLPVPRTQSDLSFHETWPKLTFDSELQLDESMKKLHRECQNDPDCTQSSVLPGCVLQGNTRTDLFDTEYAASICETIEERVDKSTNRCESEYDPTAKRVYAKTKVAASKSKTGTITEIVDSAEGAEIVSDATIMLTATKVGEPCSTDMVQKIASDWDKTAEHGDVNSHPIVTSPKAKKESAPNINAKVRVTRISDETISKLEEGIKQKEAAVRKKKDEETVKLFQAVKNLSVKENEKNVSSKDKLKDSVKNK